MFEYMHLFWLKKSFKQTKNRFYFDKIQNLNFETQLYSMMVFWNLMESNRFETMNWTSSMSSGNYILIVLNQGWNIMEHTAWENIFARFHEDFKSFTQSFRSLLWNNV
jgi:hypothetical protein